MKDSTGKEITQGDEVLAFGETHYGGFEFKLHYVDGKLMDSQGDDYTDYFSEDNLRIIDHKEELRNGKE